jgi:hypothetical protein
MCFVGAYAQEQELQHYYRGLSIETIPQPYQAFNPLDYKIVFPDSLYTTAKIHLHKAKIGSLKKQYTVFMRIENKMYKEVRILFRGKKRLELLLGLLRQMYPETEILPIPTKYSLKYNKHSIRLTVRRLGRGYEVLLEQSE